jgi:hypothetical protein
VVVVARQLGEGVAAFHGRVVMVGRATTSWYFA